MMRGETVYVDGIAVDDVLVRPGEHIDETGIDVPAGVVVAYTLGFPSDYPGSISGARITVRGTECESVGFCDHARPGDVFGDLWDGSLCRWDMAVPVQLCEGDMSAIVTVIETSSVYGADGRPIRTKSDVYHGPAQARRADGGEERIGDGSKAARESWRFVVPWDDAFSSLRPGSSTVAWCSVEYDVTGVDNIGQRSEYALFEAVRHG